MITIYEYTATNNRSGAQQVAREFGMQPANNPRMLAQQLAEIVRRHGKQAVDKLKEVHPDVDEFECDCTDKKTSNACGSCHSNIDGQAIKSEVAGLREKLSDKSELLIIGGVVILTLALILKK